MPLSVFSQETRPATTDKAEKILPGKENHSPALTESLESIDILVNPTLAGTLRRPNLARLLSPMPVLVDENLKPVLNADKCLSFYRQQKSLKKTSVYEEIAAVFLCFPSGKGIFSILPEKVGASIISESVSGVYFHEEKSNAAWMNFQVEIGNYCIIHKESGLPSIANLPASKGELTEKQHKMRAMAYASFFKRWFLFYRDSAEEAMNSHLPGWKDLESPLALYQSMALPKPKTNNP